MSAQPSRRLRFAWDLGDGTRRGGADADDRVSHTYAQPGTYTVTVRVTDEYGGTATASRTVVVAPEPPPDPGVFPDPEPPPDPEPVGPEPPPEG